MTWYEFCKKGYVGCHKKEKDMDMAIMQKEVTGYDMSKSDQNKNIELLMGKNVESEHPVAEDYISKALYERAIKVAGTSATVLIHGETGVGKEVLAKFIHANSPHHLGPFISINCAALPDSMIEAILFGYEKGAFTGAIDSYAGKFEQAQLGTLLLDEISELSLSLQAKLLRVLQEKEVERLGGKKTIKINARIIAATNQDLKVMVQKCLFRKDLFYRLNVFSIHIEPLKKRKLDVIALIQFFIRKYQKIFNKPFVQLSSEAIQKLVQYDWPGNVRELDSVIQRGMILSENNIIESKNIVFDEMQNETSDLIKKPELETNVTRLESSEIKMILDTLSETKGNKKKAAELLAISPRTLRHKIAKFKSLGIVFPY